MDWQKIDSEMTPWRTKVKNLQTRLGIGASEGCFDCKHFTCCHASISKQPILKGDWTYVGHQYGKALVGRKKAKILFISMDRTGTGEEYEEFDQTQNLFRKSAYCRCNPHMGGVDIELEHLLDEMTSPEDRCQQFALTNSVRCRPRFHKADSRSTPVMKQNCESHTHAIIQELEPNIIIAQGDNPRKSMCRLFSPTKIVERYESERPRMSSVEIRQDEDERILFLLTAHPAYYRRRLGFRWKKGDGLPTDELKKAFKQAKEIYSGV